LSKNVAPGGATGAPACNVPLMRKRVAKTKTVTLIKIALSFRGMGTGEPIPGGQRKVASA